jgi:GT2 family glycosyltransferase
VDFCLRARRAGFSCWYVPESRVVHLVGKASGINSADRQPKRTPEYVHESRRRYFWKNHGRVYTMLADAAYLMAFALRRIRRRLQRRPDTDPPHMLADFARHSVCLHPLSRSEGL